MAWLVNRVSPELEAGSEGYYMHRYYKNIRSWPLKHVNLVRSVCNLFNFIGFSKLDYATAHKDHGTYRNLLPPLFVPGQNSSPSR
jgi:hypothetical protein